MPLPAFSQEQVEAEHNEAQIHMQWCCSLCPIHVLWAQFFSVLPLGTQPWVKLSSRIVILKLRASLENLGVPMSLAYGTHDFRRGHADDPREKGIPIDVIMREGGWSSEAGQDWIDFVRRSSQLLH